jgi:hypothetical protein
LENKILGITQKRKEGKIKIKRGTKKNEKSKKEDNQKKAEQKN